MLRARVGGKKISMMIDTGATYTCVSSKEASHLPRSGHLIKTIGFSGKTQLIPLTSPIPVVIDGHTCTVPILISDDTPVNLIGRDVLCKMNCKLTCTQAGGVRLEKQLAQVATVPPAGDSTVF